jgi:predicted phosphodiesterase
MRNKNKGIAKAPAIVRKWKRIIAFGCTHGELVDPIAVEAIQTVQDRFKPDVTVHLGDYTDSTCWRAGAQGTPDESADPEADLVAGLKLLKQTRVTHLCPGNHDIRAARYIDHKDARIAHAATKCMQAIEYELKAIGVQVLKGWNVWDSFVFGGTHFCHGLKFNVNAARDMAMMMGSKCVFAHTHKVAQQHVDSRPEMVGYNVGTCSMIREHKYAEARGSTLGWSQGFVHGYFTEGRKPETRLWLTDAGRNDSREKWLLPV